MPAKFLKISADVIAQSFTYIFNLSLKCGVNVDEWKKARVIPIYKSDDQTKCENYRPISILPIISKVFETEVFRQVYTYLTEHSTNLVAKLNEDLNNVSNWMDKNKLRIHPTKSKHLFVGSNYNIKNKVCNLPISINNEPVPRV